MRWMLSAAQQAGLVRLLENPRLAAKAGAAESARFLAGHTGWFLRLGVPGGYRPERFLARAAAATLTAPAAGVAGLHLYTFNQVRETEEWRRAMLARLGGQPHGTPSQAWA